MIMLNIIVRTYVFKSVSLKRMPFKVECELLVSVKINRITREYLKALLFDLFNECGTLLIKEVTSWIKHAN